MIAGAATLAGAPGQLTITQSSARAIINWKDFSLGGGDALRFVQPDAASATLNRVISGQPTSLLGTIQANGRVFLINPNGILIGSGARIDVGGFLASTLDVSNDAFLAGGDLRLTGNSQAAVTNLGAINALGDVFLVAHRVENSGSIRADGGTAGVAGGSEVLLKTGGDERVYVRAASQPGEVLNTGTIRAAAAELKAAGGNAYALAINNTGFVRATGTAERQGQLWLVASGSGTVTNSGTLVVSSATSAGGRMTVTGGRVLLDDGSRLDASGATGGGEIYVRGGATAGGTVAVAGALDASATTSGDGGFVETSAASVTVADNARVTTHASKGSSGTWLIDPVDFTIARSGGDMTGAAVGSALAGGNFTIQSSAGATGTAGNLNVNDAITWSANALTLDAQNNINFNATLNGSSTASLALRFGQDAVAAGNSGTYIVHAAINLPAGNNFSTKLGSDGTVKNYIVITSLGAQGSTTATDVQGISGSLAGNFVLGADVDASATSSWNAGAGFAPIGNATTKFTGTFDGLGHTISGLTISRSGQANTGLFGYVGATGVLRNVGLVGGSVVGGFGTGELAGSNDGNISQSYATGDVSGTKNVGGLIGASLGPISNVWASGNVSNVSGGTGFVGGLVGNTGSTASITNGWASGSVSGLGPNVGGLVGFTTNGMISNTYATGTVSGVNFVGGLVGSGDGPVSNSYATGDVSGTGSYVGGLVGYLYPGITFTNTYAAGHVSGSASVGGLVGNNAGTVATSYWNSDVAATGIGSGARTGATGRTSAEMMQMASYTGFNIADTGGSGAVWRIYEGNTTPWLVVFLKPLTVTANDDSKTYDGVAYAGGHGVTYSVANPSPTPAGTLAFGGTAQSAVNAGSYDISISGLYSVQQGYDISYAPGTLTINKADLTLSGTRVYDGTTLFAGSKLTATGVNGETFTVTGGGATGNLSSKDVQTSHTLATINGLSLGSSSNGGLASNYNALSVANSSVSVTPAAVLLTGTRVYDGTTIFAGSNLTATGINGETFNVTGAGAAGNLGTRHVQTDVALSTVSGLILGTSSNGGVAADYTLSAGNSKISVTPADLSISTTDVVKTYDGTTTAAGSPVIVSGQLFGSDVLAASGLGPSYAYVGKGVGLGDKTVTIAGVGVNDGNNGQDYHVLLVPNTTSTINPADLTLTGTRIYDGTTLFAGSNLTATGVDGESFTVTGAGAAGNLGSKNVQTGQTLASVSGLAVGTGNSGAALASNYNALTTLNSSVSVTPRTLTIAGFTADDKVYDGTTVAVIATPGTLSGVVSGDTVGFSYTNATFDTKDVGNGKTVTLNGVALTGPGDQSNYSYTATTTDLSNITPATLTYTADLVQRLYGGANPSFTGTVTGFLGGETLATATTGTAAFTSSATSFDSVGHYGVLGAGLTANHGNYNFVQAASNATALTINPAPLTITADSKSRAVGVANPPLTASYSGFVNGETSSVVSGLSLATTATLASSAGSYPITASGASATNYTLSYVNGVLVVNRNLLTVTADNKTKTYGAPLPTFTATFDGLLNGDTSSVVTGLQFSTTATIGSNVGTYTITPFGASASGYTLAYVPGTLTINPALLTITADDKSRAFGAVNPPLTASYSGFVNGDTSAVVSGLALATSANAASPAGNYPITGSDAAAANYTIAYVDGTLVVSRNLLTITADDKTKSYGAPLPAFTASFSGLLDGDTPAVVSGLQFSTMATVGSNVGTYAITPFGGIAANYEIGYVPGVLTINPALLTITAQDAARTYGATNPAFAASFDGFVNGDTTSVVSGLGFTTPATTASGVGTYAITPGGASASNYTINYVSGLLAIDPAALTITANDATRDFGTPNPVFAASFTGLVNGDTANVVSGLGFTTPATRSSLVGDYGITPGGAVAANYTLTYKDGTLHVTAPAIDSGGGTTPVVTINDQPVITSDLAVVTIGDHRTLVPVSDGTGGTTSPSGSLDGQVTVELGKVTNPPDTTGLTGPRAPSNPGHQTSAPNFGQFQYVASMGGAGGGGSAGGSSGLTPAQLTAPGLYREASVNMGGYKVIYHEAVTEADRQADDNTAQGSSYREFPATELPRIDLVRGSSESGTSNGSDDSATGQGKGGVQ